MNDDHDHDGNDKDNDDVEAHLNQMINSKWAGKGVKLWRDVLAESVVHVKPGDYSYHRYSFSYHRDKVDEDSIHSMINMYSQRV